MMNNNNNQSTAQTKNTGLLESLPPIVPSIGFSVQRPNDSNANNVAGGTTDHLSTPSVMLVESQSNITQQNPTTTTQLIPSIIKLGNRTIQTSKAPRSWSWAPFTSSARHNDNAKFHHWVRSNVEYADYPYARFDVSLDPLVYTDEEYDKYLKCDYNVTKIENVWDLVTGQKKKKTDDMKKKNQDGGGDNNNNMQQGNANSNNNPNKDDELQYQLSIQNKILPWTKSETDALLELARLYDLRWPVIIDRWHTKYGDTPISSLRNVEDLQYRYYEVGSILAQRRAEEVMALEVAKLANNSQEVEAPAVVAADSQKSSTTVAQPAVSGPSSTVVPAATMAKTETNAKATSGVLPDASSTTSTTTIDAKPTIPSSSSTTDQQQEVAPVKPSPAEVEALQQSHAQTILHPSMAPPLSLPATGTAQHVRGTKMFDLGAERARRAQLDRVWHRTKEEEREEEDLRAELRMVEMQLRKLKRSNKHLVPAGSAFAAQAPPPAAAVAASVTSSGHGNNTRNTTGVSNQPAPLATTTHPRGHRAQHAHSHHPPPLPLPGRALLDPFTQTHQSVSASFVDTAPVPTPGTPYLQSGRLFPPSIENHSHLNKSTLKQMHEILETLSVPKDPIPTQRNCDLYDGVRKDALTLLVLQKMVLRKEGELAGKRAKSFEMQAEAKVDPSGENATAAPVTDNLDEKTVRKNSKDETMKGGTSTTKKGGGGKKRPRSNSAASAGSNQGDTKKGGDGPKKRGRKKKVVEVANAPTAPVVVVAAPAAAVVVSSAPTAAQPPNVGVSTQPTNNTASASVSEAAVATVPGPAKGKQFAGKTVKKPGRGRPRKK